MSAYFIKCFLFVQYWTLPHLLHTISVCQKHLFSPLRVNYSQTGSLWSAAEDNTANKGTLDANRLYNCRVLGGFSKSCGFEKFPCSSESKANTLDSSYSLLRTGLNRYLHGKWAESCLSKEPMGLSEDTCVDEMLHAWLSSSAKAMSWCERSFYYTEKVSHN